MTRPIATGAVLWDKKVKDIHEWLMEIGIQAPANHAPPQVVTYHESCTWRTARRSPPSRASCWA